MSNESSPKLESASSFIPLGADLVGVVDFTVFRLVWEVVSRVCGTDARVKAGTECGGTDFARGGLKALCLEGRDVWEEVKELPEGLTVVRRIPKAGGRGKDEVGVDDGAAAIGTSVACTGTIGGDAYDRDALEVAWRGGCCTLGGRLATFAGTGGGGIFVADEVAS